MLKKALVLLLWFTPLAPLWSGPDAFDIVDRLGNRCLTCTPPNREAATLYKRMVQDLTSDNLAPDFLPLIDTLSKSWGSMVLRLVNDPDDYDEWFVAFDAQTSSLRLNIKKALSGQKEPNKKSTLHFEHALEQLVYSLIFQMAIVIHSNFTLPEPLKYPNGEAFAHAHFTGPTLNAIDGTIAPFLPKAKNLNPTELMRLYHHLIDDQRCRYHQAYTQADFWYYTQAPLRWLCGATGCLLGYILGSHEVLHSLQTFVFMSNSSNPPII